MDDDLVSLHERMAALEAHRMTDTNTLTDIQEKVNAFHDEMVRYRGVVGALTLVGSGLVVIVTLFKDWFLSHWK